MKSLKQNLVIAVVLSSALSAFAGRSKTHTQFDEIIEENIKTEKVLSQQLQKEAGIVREKIEARPSLVIDPKEDKGEPDQVVVNSKTTIFKSKTKRVVKKNNGEEMKRLSQEVKEATSH